MIHNSFLCDPHVWEGDDCEDKENTVCNPYFVAGFCPTEGEGDHCQADDDDLIWVSTADGAGIFPAVKQDF